MKSITSPSTRGFTIVELLIVIVVIGILAAITIVAYNGIQDRARDAEMTSALQSASKKANVGYTLNGAYPAAAELGDSAHITFALTGDPATETFCITGSGTGYVTKSVDQSGALVTGPCEGHSGGPSYCPDDSYVSINGFYCEGSINSVASNQSHVIKLDASTSPTPASAPGAFVGRQSSRDNFGTIRFAAAQGDTFCVSGWVATVDSTVGHRLGVNFQGSYGNTWLGHVASADSARNKWVKISGCVSAPAGTTSGALWTQNDGVSGGTASAYWYQTGIRLTKQ